MSLLHPTDPRADAKNHRDIQSDIIWPNRNELHQTLLAYQYAGKHRTTRYRVIMDRFKLAGILVLVHICRVSVEGVDEMNASNNRIREESYVEEIDAMIREAKMARSLLHVVETGDGAMDRDLRKKKEKKTGHYNDRNIKDDQVKRLNGGNINGRVGGNHNSKPKGGNGKDNGDQKRPEKQ